MPSPIPGYRGRLAPSPTGLIHLGHARTFWIAQTRARSASGTLVMRTEDLDPSRARSEFTAAMLEDLHWLGLRWEEGPDRGGPFGPYSQSLRMDFYRTAFAQLQRSGCVYPCNCSRQDVLRALQAPHGGEDEPVYPGTCRRNPLPHPLDSGNNRINWRFKVPAGRPISFADGRLGHQTAIAGVDFGDFVVWRHDDSPSYQLAVVVDDAAMQISEVVRGADLLRSTARQLLLYEALGFVPPAFYHCELLTDSNGVRLAKRHDALSIRALRDHGFTPEEVVKNAFKPPGRQQENPTSA